MTNGNTAREEAILRRGQGTPVSRPSPSGAPSVPPGERGGQGTTGANEVQWISTPQSSEDYYAPGGQGQTNLNISNPVYPNYVGPPAVDTGGDTLDDLILNQDDQGATGQNWYGNHFGFGDSPLDYLLKQGVDIGDMLEHGEAKNIDPAEVWRNKMEALAAEESGPYADFLKGEAGYNDMFGTGVNLDAKINPFGTSSINAVLPFQEGGLASLANPHVDPREDVIPPMMSEGEFFFRRGRGGGRSGRPDPYGTHGMYEPKISPPFGATRENELEQLEAWGNAPHHVDPPNIGFKGEKIPAPLYNRIMKYLEGVSPAERTLLDELINREGLKNFKEKFFNMRDQKNIQPIEI